MRDGKRVVITYGTYDLLHHGHVRLMERAKELGDYLIVGVTSDAFDRERGKLNVYQSLSDRMNAVLATGIPDQVVVEEFQGQKISDIRKYGVDVFAIGSDWKGKFDYLKKYCDVVYLERTKGISSTALRATREEPIVMGCVGITNISERFVRESMHVPNVRMTHLCPLPGESAKNLERQYGMNVEEDPEVLFEMADAVYICAPIDQRARLIQRALECGCHVICEGAMALSRSQGQSLFDLAESSGLVLMEATKTLYFPAFEHLRLLVESGVVGEVKDIRASNSHMPKEADYANKYMGSFYTLCAYSTLAPFVLFGTDYLDARLTCAFKGDFCTWTKLDLLYESATATLFAGQGIKTEGDMVVTGTNGYIYVPAPWWRTEYFEIRSEDLRNTRKYYFEYADEGFRYEIFEFARRINDRNSGFVPARAKPEALATIDLIEKFDRGDITVLSSGKFSFGGGERVTDR